MAVLHTSGTASHNPRCLGETDCIDQETSWVVRIEKLHELASVGTSIPESQLATTPDATINWDIGGYVPDVVASITAAVTQH